MAGEIPTTPATATTKPEAPATVATGDQSGQTQVAPVHTDAGSLAVAHKGLRGGRSRIDGLVPGSEEADEADRLFDRIRKWLDNHPGEIHPEEYKLHQSKRDRLNERRTSAPPVRPAGPAVVIPPVPAVPRPAPVPRPADSVDNLPPPLPSKVPPVASAQISAVGSVPVQMAPQAPPFVAWLGSDLEPAFEEILALISEIREDKRQRKLTIADIDSALIAEILRDSKFSPRLQKMFVESGSRVVAKWLNRAEFSAENKDELFFFLAGLGIVAHEIRTDRRINTLIAEAKKSAVKPPEQK